MDVTSATFQIRPYKEFNCMKGRGRLLCLNRLADLPLDDHISLHESSTTAGDSGLSRNAYDFMRRRRDEIGDPAVKRWNASIRLSNFANIDNSSLCVRQQIPKIIVLTNTVPLQMASVGALIDYLVREQAMSDFDDEGIQGLKVRNIEILTL